MVPAQQNTDLKIGEAFHNFTKSSYTAEDELIKKDLSYDIDTNSKQLARTGKIFLDTQLAYAYNALFGKKADE